jgi:hypothetical protein
MNEPQDDAEEPRIRDALRELPLLDEVFLGMQAMNVDLVDAYLESWEEQLLQEYMQRDRTPFESAVSVSAFSQMWVFAVYELLRTWRGRVREIVKWADRVRDLDGAEREAGPHPATDESTWGTARSRGRSSWVSKGSRFSRVEISPTVCVLSHGTTTGSSRLPCRSA